VRARAAAEAPVPAAAAAAAAAAAHQAAKEAAAEAAAAAEARRGQPVLPAAAVSAASAAEAEAQASAAAGRRPERRARAGAAVRARKVADEHELHDEVGDWLVREEGQRGADEALRVAREPARQRLRLRLHEPLQHGARVAEGALGAHREDAEARARDLLAALGQQLLPEDECGAGRGGASSVRRERGWGGEEAGPARWRGGTGRGGAGRRHAPLRRASHRIAGARGGRSA
jgi:hypothetical protein